MLVMACRPLLAVVAAAFAVAGGCADESEPPGPPTPERVQRCLSDRKDVSSVETIAPGRPDISSLTAAQQRALKTALRPSRAALGARSGGPVEKDGGIADAPVGAERPSCTSSPARPRRKTPLRSSSRSSVQQTRAS